MDKIEDRSFVLLIIIITIAFLAILSPFAGAILWGTIMAILFMPMFKKLRASMPKYRNLAAFLTLLTIIAIVVLPSMLVGSLVLQEATTLYAKLQSGEFSLTQTLQNAQNDLPAWARNLTDLFGINDLDDMRQTLSDGLSKGLQYFASHALLFGQSALGFIAALGIMLYLTFFLLRDGEHLGQRISEALPLRRDQQRTLSQKFATAIRAIVKGSLVVAILQGAVGGAVFWTLGISAPILWGVLMAFMSLLPAVGTGIVWVPVAFYLIATGAWLNGLILTFCGVFIIGLIDNIVRPILVGKDTRIPDYVVLITTLGGLSIFGINGFVVGPVVAALFIAVWDIFTDTRREQTPP